MGGKASKHMTSYLKKCETKAISLVGKSEEDVQLAMKAHKSTREKYAAKIFKDLDKDNNGYVDDGEKDVLVKGLVAAWQKVTKKSLEESRIESILKECDLDNDGKIDKREFGEVMNKVTDHFFEMYRKKYYI